MAAGWLFWTLTEYWIHRIVFHFEPEEGPGARLHWIIHGVHHDHPNDPLRLVMPPSVSVPLAAGFYGLFVLVLGTAAGNVFARGFLLGYLVYDMTHYYLHHSQPKTRFGRLMRELHMRHHFQDDTRGFGISAPFWDYVFGTPLSAAASPVSESPAEAGSPSAAERIRTSTSQGTQAPEACASASSAYSRGQLKPSEPPPAPATSGEWSDSSSSVRHRAGSRTRSPRSPRTRSRGPGGSRLRGASPTRPP